MSESQNYYNYEPSGKINTEDDNQRHLKAIGRGLNIVCFHIGMDRATCASKLGLTEKEVEDLEKGIIAPSIDANETLLKVKQFLQDVDIQARTRGL